MSPKVNPHTTHYGVPLLDRDELKSLSDRILDNMFYIIEYCLDANEPYDPMPFDTLFVRILVFAGQENAPMQAPGDVHGLFRYLLHNASKYKNREYLDYAKRLHGMVMGYLSLWLCHNDRELNDSESRDFDGIMVKWGETRSRWVEIATEQQYGESKAERRDANIYWVNEVMELKKLRGSQECCESKENDISLDTAIERLKVSKDAQRDKILLVQ